MGKFIDQTKLMNDLVLKVMSTIQKYVAYNSAHGGCNVGAILSHWVDLKTLSVDIENDCQIGKDLDYLLSKMDRVAISSKEYPGSYDWCADIYCRPISNIVISFK